MSTILGHGIDLVSIPRIDAMLREHGERFVTRVFTAEEIAYAEAGKRRRAERYAVRFAAKEAALKALGTGLRDGIAWRDIETLREPGGRPVLRLRGRAADIARSHGMTVWRVALSHAGESAVASVIASG